MIGTQVEREGIIRHGAKMISAVSEATVPKISVVVRKAYGAGLYAMAGPAFDPDCCLALPSASIAVMGPQAAINAVYYNQLQAIEDPAERAARTEELREEYARDIDILHLASEIVVDAVMQPESLRDELIRRFAHAASKRAGVAGEAESCDAGLAGAVRMNLSIASTRSSPNSTVASSAAGFTSSTVSLLWCERGASPLAPSAPIQIDGMPALRAGQRGCGAAPARRCEVQRRLACRDFGAQLAQAG